MIAQKSAEFSIKPANGGGFRVLDKNQHNHGCYPTRAAAEEHILTLTASRAQTHRAARDLAQLAGAATLALALLVAPVGAKAAPAKPTPTPKPVITCRYERIVAWRCRDGVCRYERGTVKTCTVGAPAR